MSSFDRSLSPVTVFIDSVENRKKLHDLVYARSADLINRLASVYRSSIISTNYALFQKTIVEETSKLLISLSQEISIDTDLNEVRAEFLFQNFGYLIHNVDPRYYPVVRSDKEYRNFVLAIRDALVSGATSDALEIALERVTGLVVDVISMYLLSEHRIESSGIDIADTNILKLDINWPQNWKFDDTSIIVDDHFFSSAPRIREFLEYDPVTQVLKITAKEGYLIAATPYLTWESSGVPVEINSNWQGLGTNEASVELDELDTAYVQYEKIFLKYIQYDPLESSKLDAITKNSDFLIKAVKPAQALFENRNKISTEFSGYENNSTCKCFCIVPKSPGFELQATLVQVNPLVLNNEYQLKEKIQLEGIAPVPLNRAGLNLSSDSQVEIVSIQSLDKYFSYDLSNFDITYSIDGQPSIAVLNTEKVPSKDPVIVTYKVKYIDAVIATDISEQNYIDGFPVQTGMSSFRIGTQDIAVTGATVYLDEYGNILPDLATIVGLGKYVKASGILIDPPRWQDGALLEEKVQIEEKIICDVFLAKSEQYLDEAYKYCSDKIKEIVYTEDVSSQFNDSHYHDTYYAKYFPMVVGVGNGEVDLDGDSVQVTVNSSPVNIECVNPYSGKITLDISQVPTSELDVVEITYTYARRPIYAMALDATDSVIDTGPAHTHHFITDVTFDTKEHCRMVTGYTINNIEDMILNNQDRLYSEYEKYLSQYDTQLDREIFGIPNNGIFGQIKIMDPISFDEFSGSINLYYGWNGLGDLLEVKVRIYDSSLSSYSLWGTVSSAPPVVAPGLNQNSGPIVITNGDLLSVYGAYTAGDIVEIQLELYDGVDLIQVSAIVPVFEGTLGSDWPYTRAPRRITRIEEVPIHTHTEISTFEKYEYEFEGFELAYTAITDFKFGLHTDVYSPVVGSTDSANVVRSVTSPQGMTFGSPDQRFEQLKMKLQMCASQPLVPWTQDVINGFNAVFQNHAFLPSLSNVLNSLNTVLNQVGSQLNNSEIEQVRRYTQNLYSSLVECTRKTDIEGDCRGVPIRDTEIELTIQLEEDVDLPISMVWGGEVLTEPETVFGGMIYSDPDNNPPYGPNARGVSDSENVII